MTTAPRAPSYWAERSDLPSPESVPTLPESVDVCVIGGGIVGLTAATELAKAGREVLIVDANDVGLGVSGQSTAKVTYGTGTRLDQIASRHDNDTAAAYLDAGRVGLEWVGEHLLLSELSLGQLCTHQLCATTPDGVERLRDHTALARELGLLLHEQDGGDMPNALASVHYREQWVIQPVDYLRFLALRLVGLGVRFATQTTVRRLHGGNPNQVETDRGTISAEHVIAATHVPLGRVPSVVPWSQVRHHVAVAVLPDEPATALDIDGSWSVRPANQSSDRRALVLCGQHEVGGDDTHFAGELHRYVTNELGGTVEEQWSSQDVFIPDHLPMLWSPSPSVLTATGFGAWGFAHGTAAGLDLAHRILTDSDRWDFWSARAERLARLAPDAAKAHTEAGTSVMTERLKNLAGGPDDDEIAPGQGAVIREGTSYVAKSRDKEGRLHAVSAACTHMGCLVSWNNEAQSWDCGCHGSRFTPQGEVLHGPATDALSNVSDPT